MPQNPIPDFHRERFERILKACVYLCKEGVYPRDSYYISPAATDEEIQELESRAKFPLPKNYADYLRISNGFKFIDLEIYGTKDFGQNDENIPENFTALGHKNGGTERLAISPYDGELELCRTHPSGTIIRKPTLFSNEMYNLMYQLEEEVKKHKHKKEIDTLSPEGRRKRLEAIIERIDQKNKTCPVDTSKKPESIKECVERMRKANDLLINDFGYGEYATFGKPATEDDIKEAEKSLGFPLPEDYKEFVRLTGTIEIEHQDERIFGLDDLGANDHYTPDGYIAMSYTGLTSERLALSEEDGEVYLFWDLDPDSYAFTYFLENMLSRMEETVSEEHDREETKKMRAEGITKEDESLAINEIIVPKWKKLAEQNKKDK